ncbi:hypothetical protein ENBRE01_0521 [Enteropsectra breve]|nr:hypothetical protein ENBRE01_0521 [Enteropsectra breve]
MFEITSPAQIGKIYQMAIDTQQNSAHIAGLMDKMNIDSSAENCNIVFLQTLGRKFPFSETVTDKDALIEKIKTFSNKEIVLYTFSSFTASESLVRALRISACKGNNIYLFTFEKYKHYFVDDLVL